MKFALIQNDHIYFSESFMIPVEIKPEKQCVVSDAESDSSLE